MSAMNCCGEHAGAVSDPVFVLCTGRSGSTLLRFLLDSHPDLACPPEFRLPMVVTQLTSLCLSFEQYPLPAERGNGTAALSAAAVVRIRETVDQTIGPYLARRGKKRYCDKNLGTEQFADTLASVYPDAKFICLYRHPMDMVASGIEACPWGLANYSFEPYVAASPGNSVLALARYWADHTAAILSVEEKFPSRCHRVRYEDLVADPDGVMTEVFEFLGLPPVPEISRACFSAERERFGPGDFKIWNTSQVETDSAGRGWLVPVSMIPSPVKTSVNEIAEKLGYAQIDSAWGTAQRPAQGGQSGPMSSVTGRIENRIQAGLRRLDVSSPMRGGRIQRNRSSWSPWRPAAPATTCGGVWTSPDAPPSPAPGAVTSRPGGT